MKDERPGVFERVMGGLGADVETIEVIFAGGRRSYLSAREIAQEVLNGVDLDLAEYTPGVGARILAARDAILRERACRRMSGMMSSVSAMATTPSSGG